MSQFITVEGLVHQNDKQVKYQPVKVNLDNVAWVTDNGPDTTICLLNGSILNAKGKVEI